MCNCIVNIEFLKEEGLDCTTGQAEAGMEELITRVICKAFELFEYGNAEVDVYITDNNGIREYNREYRNIDSATDVLSFPLLDLFDGCGSVSSEDINPENNRILMGDIIISSERAKEQAKEYGHTVEREFAFLSAHGALHLMGYDHEEVEREEKMLNKQNDILNNLGITR